MERPTDPITPNPTTDRILNLTLEIITLLTGEDYSLVKTTFLLNNIYPPISTKWQKVNSSLSALTPAGNLEQKILEVTKNIVELLTGQDLAGHQEAMMDDLQKTMMEHEPTSVPRPQHEGREAPPGQKTKSVSFSGEETVQTHPEVTRWLDRKPPDSSDLMEEPRAPWTPPKKEPGSRQEGHLPYLDTSRSSNHSEPLKEHHLEKMFPVPQTRVPSSRGCLLPMISAIKMDSKEGRLDSLDISRTMEDIKEEPGLRQGGLLPHLEVTRSSDCPEPLARSAVPLTRVPSSSGYLLPVDSEGGQSSSPNISRLVDDVIPTFSKEEPGLRQENHLPHLDAFSDHTDLLEEPPLDKRSALPKTKVPSLSGSLLPMDSEGGQHSSQNISILDDVIPTFSDTKEEPNLRQGGHLPHLGASRSSDEEEPHLDKMSAVRKIRVPSSRGRLRPMDSEGGQHNSPNVSRLVDGVSPTLTSVPTLRDCLLQVTSESRKDLASSEEEVLANAPRMAELLPCEVGNLPALSVPALKGDLQPVLESFMLEEGHLTGRPLCPLQPTSAHTIVELQSSEVCRNPLRGTPSPSGCAVPISDCEKMAAFGEEGHLTPCGPSRSLDQAKVTFGQDGHSKSVEMNNPRNPVQYVSSHIKVEPYSWEEDGGLPVRELQDRYPPCQVMISQIKEEPCSWEEAGQSQPGQPFYAAVSAIRRTSFSEEEGFSCTHCGKTFLQKRELDLHFRRHSAKKRYSCAECGKTFRQKSDFENHMRVHTGERPFPCSICGKCFTTRSDRAKHHRIHTGERRFMCSLCGKGFIQKVALDKHVRVHTGEKPFSCQHCGKRFSEKSNVVRHLRVHADRK